MEINKNWRIEADSAGGVKLIFSENRIKNKDTDKEETFLYQDVFYYSNTLSALEAYLLKTLDKAKDINDCVNLMKETIKEIKLCGLIKV